MANDVTVIAGIVIPSTSPLFLGLVAAHVVLALGAVVLGVAAMVSRKGPGRHPVFGTLYYWSLSAAFAISLILAGMRWREDYPLAILGGLAVVAATLGRAARRGRWSRWIQCHIGGMGASYILMLTAFYVDNGKTLPVWRDLPPVTYWLAPALVGVPIVVAVIRRRLRVGV